MTHHDTLRLCALAAALLASTALAPARADTTAWNGKTFVVDVPNVVARSNIVLAQPNASDAQALPLGNGTLGASVSSKSGMTIQLNRADTMPYRNSPGQVSVPGLKSLTGASDYKGKLDLYNGTFTESGGGMTASVYVQPGSDTLIVDVAGAPVQTQQSVYLYLWGQRKPQFYLSGAVGALTDSWVDNTSRDPGGTGQTFGSLAAVKIVGASVTATQQGDQLILFNFFPNTDGTFRIIVGGPHFDPSSSTATQANNSVGGDLSSTAHASWWNDFWKRTALIKLTSSDGSGEYMENLRNIDLFTAAAERGDAWPGTQAGVGDLFSTELDTHQWDSAAFWHWNLRAQVAANLTSGHPELDASYFNLYRNNISNLNNWTLSQMGNAPGICVPETMRFNGKGIEVETWTSGIGYDCSTSQGAYYNTRTLSTGSEIAHWVWQHYLVTQDKNFLKQNYPLMQQAATFLLSYQKSGSDSRLHTSPSNAHETQWDVSDPTTDIAAMKAAFPDTIKAAQLLNTDSALVNKMSDALNRLPDFPRTQNSGNLTLLTASSDASGQDVIADSYQPAAGNHNSENIGLEPVWPFDVIGDQSSTFALARRTYTYRPNPTVNDWNFDPIHAARLQLPDEVKSTLVTLTQKYQYFINGLASFSQQQSGEFYIEQSAVVAAALAEALVQDYDGLIRIAPAVPSSWDFDGSAVIRGGHKVDVQVRGGKPTMVVIEPAISEQVQVKNPWPNSNVVLTSASGQSTQLQGSTLKVQLTAGSPVSMHRQGDTPAAYAPVSGTPATQYRTLGSVSIGLPPKSN